MNDEKYKWYSTLNVVSGCIWNKEAIELELIWEQKVEKKKRVRFESNKNLEKFFKKAAQEIACQ